MEYLFAVMNGNGKPCVYQLVADAAEMVQHLRGLTDVEELKRQLKKKATASVSAATL